jgi:hypothetical protein
MTSIGSDTKVWEIGHWVKGYYPTTEKEGHLRKFLYVELFLENMVSCLATNEGHTLQYNWDGKLSCPRGVVQTTSFQGGILAAIRA